MGIAGAKRDSVTLRQGWAVYVLFLLPVAVVLAMAADTNDWALTPLGVVNAVNIGLQSRQLVHLEPAGLTVRRFLRRRTYAWPTIARIEVRHSGGRSVQAWLADGRKVRLPVPVWFGRRRRADAEFETILEFWGRYAGGTVPSPVPTTAELPPRTDRIWAAAACASVYFPVPVGPVIVLLTRGRRSKYVADHAWATIRYVIALVITMAVLVLAADFVTEWAVLPLILMTVVMMGLPFIAAFQAYVGEPPLFRWVRFPGRRSSRA